MIYFLTKNRPMFRYEGITVVDDRDEAEKVIRKFLTTNKLLGIDTETEGMDYHTKKVIMFQIGNEDTQIVIDTRDWWFTDLTIALQSDAYVKLGHNLKFDYKFMLSTFGIRMQQLYDTYLAESVIFAGVDNLPKSLAAVAKRYCNVDLDKTVRNRFIGLQGVPYTEGQIRYGAYDVKYLIPIYNFQMGFIKDLELMNTVTLENEVTQVYAEIEWTGMGFSPDKWKEAETYAKEEHNRYLQELDSLVLSTPSMRKYVRGKQFGLFEGTDGREVSINWASPDQVTKVLKELGVPTDTAGKQELFKYQNQFSIITPLLKYKEALKKLTTYGEEFLKFVHPETRRIHTTFKQVLETGRIASSEPNMQNIPASNTYRNAFIAGEGKVMVSCDFSQQELRIIANNSEDPIWLAAFKTGKDLHSEVASMVFGIDPANSREKIPGMNKTYRDVAKTINFGLAYGMSEYKLADTLMIPIPEAKKIIDRYFAALPKVKRYLDASGSTGKTYGYIKTNAPYSRIRWFYNPLQGGFDPRAMQPKELGAIERESKNTPIQGTGADMCKLALVKLFKKTMDKPDKVRIVMTVHDQIDCVVDEDYAEEWSQIMAQTMEEAGKESVSHLPMTAESTISKYWQK